MASTNLSMNLQSHLDDTLPSLSGENETDSSFDSPSIWLLLGIQLTFGERQKSYRAH
jgi:hypothetical protein